MSNCRLDDNPIGTQLTVSTDGNCCLIDQADVTVVEDPYRKHEGQRLPNPAQIPQVSFMQEKAQTLLSVSLR
jgi:hypothetical protein